MNKNSVITTTVKELIDSQLFGVLGSSTNRFPYLNLMAFIPYDNYRSLIFATEIKTRKYLNLKKHPECSMFIDNQRNQSSDICNAKNVCICGKACELAADDEYDKIKKLYLERHPKLESFINSPNIAIFKLKISTYYFLENFKNVTEIEIEE